MRNWMTMAASMSAKENIWEIIIVSKLKWWVGSVDDGEALLFGSLNEWYLQLILKHTGR